MKGTVSFVGSKDFNDQKYWSFQLEESDTYIRTGTRRPYCKVGDLVEFKTREHRGATYVDGNVEVLEWGSKRKGNSSQGRNSGRASSRRVGSGSRDNYWEKKAEKDEETGRRVTWAGSMNTAIDLVRLMLENNALKLPTKQADKWDVIREVVVGEAEKLYEKARQVGDVGVEKGEKGDPEPSEEPSEPDWNDWNPEG